jgi:hypothetical protein
MFRQVTTHFLAQYAGSLAMNNQNPVQPGPKCRVQEIIELGNSLIDGEAMEIYFFFNGNHLTIAGLGLPPRILS